MSTTPEQLPASLAERLRRQLDSWRNDLFSVDRRQRLVYFKHTKTRSFELTSPKAASIADAISTPLILLPDEGPASSRPTVRVLGKTDAELAAEARRLDVQVQQVHADRGFWTLYIGIGMITWVDPDDGKRVDSPVILCPVRLERSGTQSPYFVVRTDDDIVINPALRLHLNNTFGIELPDVDPDGGDIADVLTDVRGLVEKRPDWGIQDRCVLATFSFHKEAIYRDLTDHESSVVAHPIVQLIGLGADAPSADSFAFEPPGSADALDDVIAPENLLSILDADASQRACILAALDDKSFVMDGPPGTGKSQTIANMIAELMAAGKTVLFVSEKAAALDVVRDRLAAKGLGDFTLQLHSHAATRHEVVKQLHQALTHRVTGRGEFTESERKSLVNARHELTAYSKGMNEVRRWMNRSLFTVLGRVAMLNEFVLRPLDDTEAWAGLTDDRLDGILMAAERLGTAWRPASEGDDFLWRGLAATEHSPSVIADMGEQTDKLYRLTRELMERLHSVDEALLLPMPLDLPAAQRRCDLLALLEERPDIPVHWLTGTETTMLKNRVQSLSNSVRAHTAATTELEGLVGEGNASRVDPETVAPVADPTLLDGLPWQPAGSSTDRDVAAARDALSSTPAAFVEVLEDARQLGAMLGIRTDGVTLNRATELAHLGSLAASSALPERAWLNPAVHTALQESMRVLGPVVELVRERKAAVEAVFNAEALAVDLQGLEVRFRETHRGMRRMSKAAREDKKLLKSIAVSGRANRPVRERLAEAVAWQKAEAALESAERQHASTLGGYYERTSTDFGRLAQAVETAQRAVALAGNDLNSGPLADQLASDGTPDPRLTLIAQRLLKRGTSWVQTTGTALGESEVRNIADMPLDVAAEIAARGSDQLATLHDAMSHLAELAGRAVTLDEAHAARSSAVALSDATAAVFNTFDADSVLLGPAYEGLSTDWSRVDKQIDWLERTLEVLGGHVSQPAAERMVSPVLSLADVQSKLNDWGDARSTLVRSFDAARAAELQRDLAVSLQDASELLADMRASLAADVAEWDAYSAASKELDGFGLTSVQKLLVEKRVAPSAVRPYVERAVLAAWVEATVAGDSRLRNHRSVDRDQVVDKFRELDAQLVSKAHIKVASACSARRPGYAGTSAAQLIQKEAQKKRRHVPIRELLERTSVLVQELKPCFMMSPLSVSQFLPGQMTFDVVIFDEASQVLPSDAVNCIYRGSQLIVAGDEKQLPPTSFFAKVSASDDEDDEDLAEYESVLKACKSALPSLPLTWHYRSQHESLIMFSNYRFYAPDQQPLQTFPGATFDSDDLGVEAYLVNGIYRKGTTRDNPIEAAKVIDRVLFHRQEHPELSIGVVTFSSAQEQAVWTELERRALDEPELAALLDSHNRLDGFFVKNLENVQGDERDIIVFSIGYGPDEFGNPTSNFGPINRAGGWRRLNVAITRARRRVEVVTSVRSGDIKDTGSESLRHLRGYLELAERGQVALASDPIGSLGGPESEFELDVLSVINSWGYETVPQVGSAGFRIDIGVRHPDRPGEYALAVECDGAAYHSAATARDRDRLREGVLRGLGWNIHRIWGISWYRDRVGESARLKAAIEAAVAGGRPAPVVRDLAVDLDAEHIDLDAPPAWARAYVVCGASAPYTYHQLSSPDARPALQSFLAALFATEAPIHKDLVNRRVRDAFGVGRVGSLIQDNIEYVARRLRVNGEQVELDRNGFFTAGPVTDVRVPENDATVRPLGQIHPGELDLAVGMLIADAITMEDDEVAQGVARIFGWRRTGADIQAAVTNSIARGLRAGRLARTRDGSVEAVL